jgi:SNF family Na+-dependent transporter
MAEKKKTFSSSSYDDNTGRARWSSRTAFYFAAIGSAVGFGNVWRFPSLAADFGGGAFFVPYLLAFLVVGLPILFLEIGLGQYHQTGDVGAFGSFHKHLGGICVCSIGGTYVARPVYGILFAWILRAFFESFSDDAPWINKDITGSEAFSYFFDEIVEQSTLGEGNRPTTLVGTNVGYSAASWFITWLCVAWGVKWTGRVTYITMGLPIVLLFIFLGRALS